MSKILAYTWDTAALSAALAPETPATSDPIAIAGLNFVRIFFEHIGGATTTVGYYSYYLEGRINRDGQASPWVPAAFSNLLNAYTTSWDWVHRNSDPALPFDAFCIWSKYLRGFDEIRVKLNTDGSSPESDELIKMYISPDAA